ncbi:heterokaryon incompatibility protein-domain-containing protein [Xylaria telfairii]|nr:heterokaryon incompatibility protein-domain-containing protein [Xylaria telfairii]
MDYVKARKEDMIGKSKAACEVAISQNPEKIRTILNSLFVPNFKPTFESDSDEEDSAVAASTEFDSVDLLAPSYSSAIADPGGLQNRFPYRMIDLDTKELVVRPEIGTLGQYCILSHSWKFPEVTYKHFAAAKFTAFNKTIETGAVVAATRLSDVDATKRYCWSELIKQEDEVKRLVHGYGTGLKLEGIVSERIVEGLLKRLKDAREAESGPNGQEGEEKLRKAHADAIAAKQYQNMEAGVLKDLLGDIGLDKDSIQAVVGDDLNDIGPKKTETEVDRAARIVEERRNAKIDQASTIQFFSQYGDIRNALDRLVNCVTLCRSMIKIEQSIERCKEIFDRNCFPKTQKRYVWIDTCCIDKDDDGEYIRSISAMGDWYKNAEFCLVHLDSPKDFAQEWLDDWEMFSPKAREWVGDWEKFNLDEVTPVPNISTYDEIHRYKPQWSTRAWTLQELIMSKTTFFVNSSWVFLSRPVESLGYWYYLCPYVSLYCDLDTGNPFLGLLKNGEHVEELARLLDPATIELGRLQPVGTAIGQAQRIIAMLDSIDFRIRGDIDLYTARAWVTQAINITASRLETASNNLVAKVLDVLKPIAKASVKEYSPSDVTTIRHVIGILLKCLVTLIEQPIMDDRNYIADFGNVQNLRMWQSGLVRSNFSTSKSMALMCPRDATEEIDRAYGLMGMLGVRFPTFKAEGLTKALSRLLDEVVITSNDVSVFNWSGKQYGSPLRGRSLYPSLPEAYTPRNEESHKNEIEKRLATLLQLERYECLNDFEQIQGMLLGVLDFIKRRQLKEDRVIWIREILRIMKRSEFKYLKPHIQNVGKILKYIENKAEDAATSNRGKGPGEIVTGAGDTPEPLGAFDTLSSSLSSLSSQVKMPSLPRDMISFKAPKFGPKKTVSEAATSSAPSSRVIGGFKAPSLKGFGRKGSEGLSSVESPKGDDIPAALAGSKPLPLNTPKSIKDEVERLEHERLRVLNAQVLSYIRSIDSVHPTSDNPVAFEQAPTLPDELKNVLADIPDRKFSRPRMELDDIETMISPNPILVKSSGIESLFDIQRVIVTMPQSAKLRRQVRNAISPTQKITGWCSISTGFAMVFTRTQASRDK